MLADDQNGPRSRSPDEADLQFLTVPNASVTGRLVPQSPKLPELQIFGNRAGMLSLGNVLLWLVANAWRREFLTLAELPFVRLESSLSVCIRVTGNNCTGLDGSLCRTDRGEQFEWAISEDDLQRVALSIHHLACAPHHEYDRLRLTNESDASIHVRMTDATRWLQSRQTMDT